MLRLRHGSRVAPISAERNSSTRLPSLDVPSPNSTTGSPPASRCAISAFTSAVFCRRVAIDEHGALQLREQAEERPAGDFLLGDENDRRDDVSTEISSHETWFDTIISGAAARSADDT